MRKYLLFLSFVLLSCVTDDTHTKPAIQWKYVLGECVKFNPAKVKKTDGTPMMIIGYDHTKHKYYVAMYHPLVPGKTSFTALKVPFEQDTILISCKKGVK